MVKSGKALFLCGLDRHEMSKELGQPPKRGKETKASKMRAEFIDKKTKKSRAAADGQINLDDCVDDWVRIRNMEQSRQITSLKRQIDKLNEEMKELKLQLEEKRQIIGDLKRERGTVDEVVVLQFDDEANNVNPSFVKDLEERGRLMEEENRKLSEYLQELEKEKQEACEKLKQLESEKEDTRKLIAKLRQFKAIHDELIIEMGLVDDGKANSPNVIEAYQAQIRGKDAHLQETSDKLTQTLQHCKELEASVSAHESRDAEKTKSIEELQLATENLKEKLVEVNVVKDNLLESIRNMEDLLHAETEVRLMLEDVVVEKNKNINELNEKVQKYFEAVKSQEGSDKLVQELQDEVSRLERELNDVTRKYEEVLEERARREENHTTVNDLLKTKLSTAENRLLERNNQITELEEVVVSAKEEVLLHATKLTDAEKQFQTELSERDERGNSEKEKLVSELKNVQSNLDEKTWKLDSLRNEYDGRLEIANEENERLTQQLEKAKMQVYEKQEECAKCQEQLSQSFQNINELSAKVSALQVVEEDYKKLEEKIEEIKQAHVQEIRELTESNYQAVQDVQDESDLRANKLKKELHEKGVLMSEMKEELKFCLDELNMKTAELKELRREHREMCAKAERHAQNLRDDVQIIQEQNEIEMMTEIKKVRVESDERMRDLENQKNQELEQQKLQYEEKIQQLQNECEILKANHARNLQKVLEDQLRSFKEEKSELEQKIKDEKMKVEELSEQKSILSKQKAKDREKLESLIDQQQTLLSYIVKSLNYEKKQVANKDMIDMLAKLEANFDEKFQRIEKQVTASAANTNSSSLDEQVLQNGHSMHSPDRSVSHWFPGQPMKNVTSTPERNSYKPITPPTSPIRARSYSPQFSRHSPRLYEYSPEISRSTGLLQMSPGYDTRDAKEDTEHFIIPKHVQNENAEPYSFSDSFQNSHEFPELQFSTTSSPTHTYRTGRRRNSMDSDDLVIIPSPAFSGPQSPVSCEAMGYTHARNDSGLGYSHRSDDYHEQLRSIAETIEKLQRQGVGLKPKIPDSDWMRDFEVWKQRIQNRLKILESGIQADSQLNSVLTACNSSYADSTRAGAYSPIFYKPSNDEIRLLVKEVNEKFEYWRNSGKLVSVSLPRGTDADRYVNSTNGVY